MTGTTPVGNASAFPGTVFFLAMISANFSPCPVEEAIIGVVECGAVRVSLVRLGPIAFYWEGVWLTITGQLVVYRDIYIVRDDGLLSFVANDRVLCLPAILRVFFAKIVSFFYLGPEMIIFTLQVLSAIL